MSLSNKVIRCHILDRKDQLESAKWWQSDAIKKTKALEKEVAEQIAALQKKLVDHHTRIKKNQKHIEYLESTMDIHWIDNPPY